MKCPFCGYLEDKVVDSRESRRAMRFGAAENVSDVNEDLPPTNASTRFLIWL